MYIERLFKRHSEAYPHNFMWLRQHWHWYNGYWFIVFTHIHTHTHEHTHTHTHSECEPSHIYDRTAAKLLWVQQIGKSIASGGSIRNTCAQVQGNVESILILFGSSYFRFSEWNCHWTDSILNVWTTRDYNKILLLIGRHWMVGFSLRLAKDEENGIRYKMQTLRLNTKLGGY